MTDVQNRLFRAQITVPVNERAIVLVDGRIVDILRPGRHTVNTGRGKLAVESCNLLRPELVSEYDHVLFQDYPELAAEHFTEVRTGIGEVAFVKRDGRPYALIAPEARVVYFTDAGPFEVKRIDITEDPQVSKEIAGNALFMARHDALIRRFVVDHGHAGLLFIENRLERRLKPGVYAFFDAGRAVNVRTVDLRRHTIDVNGQEMLTKDRVTIRVNLAAEYTVTDPEAAVTQVKDFEEALYRALQYAFRKSLGTKSLDEILANKVSVDDEAAKAVRKEMAAIGIEVGGIALKDVILPGEMREILNQVVQAEKEAQANVIRRREETAATRSLLNTAKVMADNPVMLRLKELEALETVADKVQYLAVHNGTQGLLEDLVTLRGKD